MKLRRKTRETARHERAVVLQELGEVACDPRDWQRQREIEMSRMKRALKRGGGHHDASLGLVTKRPGAGGTAAGPCQYCNGQAGGCWFCGRG